MGGGQSDLLQGNKDPRFHRLVGITFDQRSGIYTLYRRENIDRVQKTNLKSSSYMIVDDTSLLQQSNAHIQELLGPHPLRYIATFKNEDALRKARRKALDAYSRSYGADGRAHLWWQPPIPAMMFRSGITMFKDMELGQEKTIALDIETYTSKGKHFSNADDPEDRILLVSLSSNRGQTWLLSSEDQGEASMLQALTELIVQEDPDVICGHNLIGFDLPYLQRRSELHSVKLTWGRDGSRLYGRQRMRRGRNIQEWVIPGRHVVDTLQALLSYDFTARNLPGYQLKEAVVHLGLSAEDRTSFDRSAISELWHHSRDTLCEYALADARDTLELYKFLMPSAFFQTQILPYPFQDVCTLGTGTKVDSLLVRAYLQQRQALPLRGAAAGEFDSGGLVDVYRLGWIKDVVKADAASLYPSICLTYGIKPKQDHLNAFLQTLSALTKRRLTAKQELRSLQRNTVRFRALDAWQNSLKVLINSYYGMLGTGGLHFSDPAAAAAITRRGQQILLKMVADVQAAGGMTIEIDTDGIYFVPPEEYHDKADLFVKQVLGGGQDEGIRIEYDGRYQAMYSYAPKNYLLVEQDGIKRKGVVFRSRRLFGLQDSVISEVSKLLATGQLLKLAQYYRALRLRATNRQLTIDEVSTYAPVNHDFSAYHQRLAGGGSHNRAYDLIFGRKDQAKWVERSKIVYYHRTGGELGLSEEYDNDYDIAWYLDLLDRTVEKFAYAFPPDIYNVIFSTQECQPTDILYTWSFSPKQTNPVYNTRNTRAEMISFINPVHPLT